MLQLPVEIGKLSKLRHLSLHCNVLEEFTPGIGGCTSLVWISSNCNKLKTLPPEVGKLTNLCRWGLHINEVRGCMLGGGGALNPGEGGGGVLGVGPRGARGGLIFVVESFKKRVWRMSGRGWGALQ